MSDQEALLIQRAQSGDRAAFGRLVEAYWTVLATYLLRLTGDREVASELTQDTFLHAYRSIGRTRPGLLLRPWLYRIATNLALNYRRRHWRFQWLPLGTVGHVAGRDDFSPVEEGHLIQQVLASLRPNERAVLLLCGSEGLSFVAAATVLGSTPEAVRKQFSRASERFRRAYLEVEGP